MSGGLFLSSCKPVVHTAAMSQAWIHTSLFMFRECYRTAQAVTGCSEWSSLGPVKGISGSAYTSHCCIPNTCRVSWLLPHRPLNITDTHKQSLFCSLCCCLDLSIVLITGNSLGSIFKYTESSQARGVCCYNSFAPCLSTQMTTKYT